MSEFWGSTVLVSPSLETVREGGVRVLSNYTRLKLVFPSYQLICLSNVVLWGHIWVLLRVSCLLLTVNCQFMFLESITIGRNNKEAKHGLEDEDV